MRRTTGITTGRAAGAALVVTALLLAACGDSDDTDEAADERPIGIQQTPTDTPSAPATPAEPSATITPPPTGLWEGGRYRPEDPEGQRVEVWLNSYNAETPEQLEVLEAYVTFWQVQFAQQARGELDREQLATVIRGEQLDLTSNLILDYEIPGDFVLGQFFMNVDEIRVDGSTALVLDCALSNTEAFPKDNPPINPDNNPVPDDTWGVVFLSRGTDGWKVDDVEAIDTTGECEVPA